MGTQVLDKFLTDLYRLLKKTMESGCHVLSGTAFKRDDAAPGGLWPRKAISALPPHLLGISRSGFLKNKLRLRCGCRSFPTEVLLNSLPKRSEGSTMRQQEKLGHHLPATGTDLPESCERLWSWHGPLQLSRTEIRASGLYLTSHPMGKECDLVSSGLLWLKAKLREGPRGEPSATNTPSNWGNTCSSPGQCTGTSKQWVLTVSDWFAVSGPASWGQIHCSKWYIPGLVYC